MVYIHISGTPGSGKTTLGKKLSKLFSNFKVVETDGFVTNKDRKKRDKYIKSKILIILFYKI